MVVKQDISTFRFETYGMMQKLEEAISTTQKQNEKVYQHVQLLEHAVMASKLEDNEMVKALHQQLMESTNQSDEKFRSLERQFSASHDLLLQNQTQAKRSSMGSNLFRQLGKELGERLVKKREDTATLVQQGPQITKTAEKTKKTTTIGVQTDDVGLTYTLPVAIEEELITNDSDGTVKGVVNEGFQDDEGNSVKARITESEAKASNNLEGQDEGDAAEVQGETTSDINFEVNSSLAGESTNDALTRRHILPRQLSTESEAPSLGYSRSDKPESRRVKNIVKSIDLTEDPAAIVDEDETDIRDDIREVEEGLRKSGAEWTVIPYDASKE
ncbi:uncharacterized protein [Ptychodera flava]|uniref:uncharacterized protein n=1 Tax=Ptychodera flava TaxID=63121 RepID=UPI00396A3A04